MNILKKTVLAGLMVGVCASFSFADSLILTGEVPAINTVSFTPGMHLSDNLQSAILNNFSIGQIQVDNNDPEGFSLSVSSLGVSNLQRYVSGVAQDAVAGDQVAYTLRFTDGTGILGVNAGDSTLGSEEGTAFAGVDHTLSDTPVPYYFDQSRSSATVAKKYGVTIVLNAGAAASHLFNSAGSDIYKDTITITMTNL